MEINKSTQKRAEPIALWIAPDFGSPSRRAKGSILYVCDFWRNAEDGPKDKQDCGFIYFHGPYPIKGLEVRYGDRS